MRPILRYTDPIMWLPKDERLILAGLYHNIDDGRDEAYYVSDLARLLKTRYRKQRIPEYGDVDSGKDDSDDGDQLEQIKAYIADEKRVGNATRQLASRGLITLHLHQDEQSVLVVALTLPGCDLGRQYASWLSRTGLGFQEYKGHWLTLILGFVGGVLVTKIVDWLFK